MENKNNLEDLIRDMKITNGNDRRLKDLEFGKIKESMIKPLLEEKFGVTLKETKKYNRVDFQNEEEKIIFELKGRTNPKDKYKDTMISYSKVLYCIDKIKKGYRTFFVFSYTDKNCYYELTEKINQEWIKEGGRWDRGKLELNRYYYIPITELLDF